MIGVASFAYLLAGKPKLFSTTMGHVWSAALLFNNVTGFFFIPQFLKVDLATKREFISLFLTQTTCLSVIYGLLYPEPTPVCHTQCASSILIATRRVNLSRLRHRRI